MSWKQQKSGSISKSFCCDGIVGNNSVESGRLAAAIESWKASFFVRSICTHGGWRESVAIWMCKLPAAIQAEVKEFELLLLFATVQ